VIDEHTRESMLHIVERSITADRLVTHLQQAFDRCGGPPKVLRMDNGPKFIPNPCKCSAATGSVWSTFRRERRGTTGTSNRSTTDSGRNASTATTGPPCGKVGWSSATGQSKKSRLLLRGGPGSHLLWRCLAAQFGRRKGGCVTMMAAIRVVGLDKVFKVPERDPGLRAALRSVVNRKYREVRAVSGISFEIDQGEVVGFLGPNGAGKTTTLKTLSGLLFPTGGEVSVLGFRPSRREAAYLRQMALVMGNRNQLQWDIPATDSFEMNRAVYRIPHESFRRVRDELIELLEVGDLVKKPVRTLSLGERMKVELIGSLLHTPKVVFLDEPTLGLDVTMQKRLREFVGLYNRRYGATVLLTSHYMADVEALCERVILIDKGRIRYEGGLADLTERVAAYKELGITLADANADVTRYGDVLSAADGRFRIRVPKADTARVTARLLAEQDVLDLTVEDPPIEDVIELMFGSVKEPE